MIQIELSNPSFESCIKCIHSDDSEETCILRRCIHAVAQLNECYVPKQPTIEPERKWSGLWSEPKNDNSVYGEKLMEGDTIYLLGVEGTVRQENGAWGWGSCKYVPWEELESKLPHNNSPTFCYCDNFISFWELKWNFDDGDDWDGVPFIRHGMEMTEGE